MYSKLALLSNNRLLIKTQLMYSKLAFLSKLIYTMKNPRFFIQAAVVLKDRSSVQNSLALSKSSWCTQRSLFYLNSYKFDKSQIFYPSRCCTQRSLFCPKLACFIQIQLEYPKIAVLSKLYKFDKSQIFYVNLIKARFFI